MYALVAKHVPISDVRLLTMADYTVCCYGSGRVEAILTFKFPTYSVSESCC